MKNLIFLFTVLISCANIAVASDVSPISSLQASMGSTCLVRHNTAAIQFTNPALIDVLKGTSFSFEYRRLYDIAELDLISLAFAHDFGFIKAGIAFYNYGDADFWSENMLSVSASKVIIGNIAVGLKTEYHRVSFNERFGSANMLSFTAGVAYFDEDFIIHASLSDINKPRYSDSDNKVEPGYRFGLSIKSIAPIVMNLEMAGSENGDQRFCFGQEINFEKKLFVRFGLITNPTLPSAGFGLRYNNICFNYSLNYHNILGDSHCLGISVSF